jgi:phage-related protein
MTIASAGADMQTALNWLRGSGTMILGNEPDYAYSVRLDAQLQMDKQYTNMWSGSLQMRTEPFKRASAASSAIEVTTSGTTVNNPGNVPARPKITLTGSGSTSLTIGGKTLTFTGLTSGTVVDLQNQWILVSGTPTAGIVSGEFGAFPAGNSTVTFTGLTKVTIPQEWLYV